MSSGSSAFSSSTVIGTQSASRAWGLMVEAGGREQRLHGRVEEVRLRLLVVDVLAQPPNLVDAHTEIIKESLALTSALVQALGGQRLDGLVEALHEGVRGVVRDTVHLVVALPKRRALEYIFGLEQVGELHLHDQEAP